MEPKIVRMSDLEDFDRPPRMVRYDAKNDCYEFDDRCDGFSRNPDLSDDNRHFYYWNDACDFDSVQGMAESLLHLLDKTWFLDEHVRQLCRLISDRQRSR